MLKKKKSTLNWPLLLGSGSLLLFGGISMYQVATSAAHNNKSPQAKASPAVVKPAKVAASIPAAVAATPRVNPEGSVPVAQMPILTVMPKAAPALAGERKPLPDDSPDLVNMSPVIINIVSDEHSSVKTKEPAPKREARTKPVKAAKPKVVPKKPAKVVSHKPVVKAAAPTPAAPGPSVVRTDEGSGFSYSPGKVKEVVPSSQPVADPSVKYDLKEGKAVTVKKPMPIHATATSVWVKLDATRTVKVNQGDSVEGLGVYQGMVEGKVKFNGQLLPLGQ